MCYHPFFLLDILELLMAKLAPVFLFQVLLLQSCIVSSATAYSNATDQSALLAFRSEIRLEPSSALFHNWSTETSFCNWIGVSCSKRRERVTGLKLPHMGLQGTISSHIRNLSFLVLLDLHNNSFHGPLPHDLSYLRRLKIVILEKNQLEGSIPPSLCHCRALQALYLAGNKFTGVIPTELGILPKLEILYLGANLLKGAIPPSLSNISTLEDLSLGENNLTGPIPSDLFNITTLGHIYLGSNILSGPLPMDICRNSHKLQNLILDDNQLSGQIPSTIGKCRELQQFDVTFNELSGSIPKEIGSLPMLQYLYVGNNKFSGTIPSTVGNISTLEHLYAGTNHIHGKIPVELGHLSKLVELNFEVNSLSGVIPEGIFNISTLQYLSFSFNALSGNLPMTTGLQLPDLEELRLQDNRLSGNIPLHLPNSSKLTVLDLDMNSFIGPVPVSFGNLKLLNTFFVGTNQLTREEGTSELRFLTALSRCKSLEMLGIEDNKFDGFMPTTIGNNSSPLQMFTASGSQIRGQIPEGIGSFKNLYLLDLSFNAFDATIPSRIGELEGLQQLYLEANKLQGRIPQELCNLTNLGDLLISSNNISGPIPSCIGNLSRLQKLDLSSNGLISAIPLSIWNLENLIVLNLSTNYLDSYIPRTAKLNVIEILDLSVNRISGTIPSIIGDFQRLSSLNLSNNSLEGPIPQTLGSLVALEYLVLSHNNLSGAIPKSLQGLKNLRQLDLSFNNLSGEIPSGGPFSNFTVQSFIGNGALCGKALLKVSSCSYITSRSKTRQLLLKVVLPVILLLATLAAIIHFLRAHQQSNASLENTVALVPAVELQLIPYHELVHATNNFSGGNMIGRGSIGTVYKGVLSDGVAVAIKVLNLQIESAFRCFDAECMVLRAVRHRNLVKVISSCSNPEFRALILQYMPNGSLEQWLYSHNNYLNLQERVSIMVDVALAMEYLHHGQAEPIVHCDLKPSNILLDEDIVAHVGDFGIAKILAENQTATQTKTLGTLGYIAPEYGSEGRVSTKCDIYSYGIVVLEMLTRKKPTDEMFSADLSLRQWVNAAFPDNIMEVLDGNLIRMEDELERKAGNHLLAIFELGLECSNDLPEERVDIRDVAGKMTKIRTQLLGKTRA